MTYENKPGEGVAFLGKSTHPKAPKWRGHVFHHETGKRIDLSIWERTSKAGTPYLSIAASEPRSMSQEAGLVSAAGKATAAPNDDLPPF